MQLGVLPYSRIFLSTTHTDAAEHDVTEFRVSTEPPNRVGLPEGCGKTQVLGSDVGVT